MAVNEAPSAPALRLHCGAGQDPTQTFEFDDDEHRALGELDFLYGTQGARLGRMRVVEATLSQAEVRAAQAFLTTVRGKLTAQLEVYDHGRGPPKTICFQHRPWVELIKRSGLRYRKPTPVYVPGRPGQLSSIEPFVYVNGRRLPASAPELTPQTLGEVPAVQTALDKLAQALAAAAAGAPLRSAPRNTYEAF